LEIKQSINNELIIKRGAKNKSPFLIDEEFEDGIPFCRRFNEIYYKFQSNILKDRFKKKMIEYSKGSNERAYSLDTINNWFICRDKDADDTSKRIPVRVQNFLRKLCEEEMLDYELVFDAESRTKDYTIVKSFVDNILVRKEIDISSPSDNYEDDIHQEELMLSEEEITILKELVNTNKDIFINELKKLLSNKKQIENEYSNELVYKIAYYAFERHANKECIELLNRLDGNTLIWFKEFNQLKAKALSKEGKDKDAIDLLKDLKIKEIKAHNAASNETVNLLAASLKRNAIKDKNELDEESKYQLQESKEEYGAIYRTQHSYYSAINVAYLEVVLNPNLKNARKKIEELWENVDIEIVDWWSFITDVEIDMLLGKYDHAKRKLHNINKVLDTKKISNFNVYSTRRQIEDFYYKFTQTLTQSDSLEIKYIISILNSLENTGTIANELIND
jgi:hypothetical protein